MKKWNINLTYFQDIQKKDLHGYKLWGEKVKTSGGVSVLNGPKRMRTDLPVQGLGDGKQVEKW